MRTRHIDIAPWLIVELDDGRVEAVEARARTRERAVDAPRGCGAATSPSPLLLPMQQCFLPAGPTRVAAPRLARSGSCSHRPTTSAASLELCAKRQAPSPTKDRIGVARLCWRRPAVMRRFDFGLTGSTGCAPWC
jgi:hypothetical protein